ncbi:MFS transporter [Streptomyces sp. NPDC047042]|uniref:MFS transporter n=1 Tax=Streptomyces sp. NPDC047042 TaxID=3154807 RepID=UPI0033E27701
MKLSADLQVLRVASFRTYCVGRSVSELGSSMVLVAVPFAVFSAGGDAGDIGLVMGAGMLPRILLLLLGGVLGDRLERRSLLLATDVVLALCQLCTAALLLGHGAQVWSLAAVQLVSGSARALQLPATGGAVQDFAPRTSLQQAISLLRLANSTSSVVGPAMAGLLVVSTAPGWVFVVDAASFVFSAAAMARLPRGSRTAPANKNVLKEAAEGWSAFVALRWVWLMVASFAVYQATVLPAVFIIGPQMSRTGLGPGAWAAILTARSVGAILVALPLLRWRARRPLVASLLVLLLDVPFFGSLWIGAPLAVILIAAALSSAGLNAADTLWETTLQENVSPGLISRISSYDWMGSLAFSPLGYLLVGTAVQHTGVRECLLAVTILHLVVHLLLPLAPAIRHIGHTTKDAPSTQDAESAPVH